MGARMELGGKELVGRGLGQLAGVVAFALALLRLNRLLQSGPGIPRWPLILIAAAVLGGVVWWLLTQMIRGPALRITVFTVAAAALFLRISVVETLAVGILPTGDALSALGPELGEAVAQIRRGVPPIVPSEGVIAILGVVFWIVGGLFTRGLTSGVTAALVAPSVVLYLQFATLDRTPAGVGWMLASALMLALGISAVALERRRDAGKARDAQGRTKPQRATVATLVMALAVSSVALVTANSASGTVSEYGNLPFQQDDSLFGPGSGSGTLSLQRFVDLQQRLISRDNIPLFRAFYEAGAPDITHLYYRTEALDEFNGDVWRRTASNQRRYEEGVRFADPANTAGEAGTFVHKIQIENLTNEVLPTAGVAVSIHDTSDRQAISPKEIHTLFDDGALLYPPRTRPGQTYQVEVFYPATSREIGTLATGADGTLTPLFQAAADAGAFTAEPSAGSADVGEPMDLEALRQGDDSIPASLTNLATNVTRGATTDFEQAWMLQHFLRDGVDQTGNPNFTYDATVSTGYGTLDLTAWLTDPASQNYRTGYCSQFAAAMAVMAREVGLASRVVLGFTPGTFEQGVDANGETVDYIQVRDTNAHAWVEIWVEGHGWVLFDPTPRRAAEPETTQPESITAGVDLAAYVENLPTPPTGLPFPGGIGGDGFDDLVSINDPGFINTSSPRYWLVVLLGVMALASAAPLIKRLRKRRRIHSLRTGDITAAWDQLVDRLGDIGDPIPANLTPVEFAKEKDLALVGLATSYASTVYGGVSGQGSEADLHNVEDWVSERYRGLERLKGAFNPRSLLHRTRRYRPEAFLSSSTSSSTVRSMVRNRSRSSSNKETSSSTSRATSSMATKKASWP